MKPFGMIQTERKMFPYSTALNNMLQLEQSDTLKSKIFTFLVYEYLVYDDYSVHLDLACSYLIYFLQDKDDNYKKILKIVQKQVEITCFKNCLYTMETVYKTLKDCTNEQKYIDALSEINLKLTYNNLDNQIDISAFDFLCHLCNVWLKDYICYDKLEQYNEIIEQEDKKKQFLNKHKHAPKVITKNEINAEFLLINAIVNSLHSQQDDDESSTYAIKINEYQTLIDDCNKIAYENLDDVINMILEENPNYTEQIMSLREQWEEQIVYEEEDGEF